MIWTSNADGLLRYNGTWQFFPVPGTASQGIRSMAQDQEHTLAVKQGWCTQMEWKHF